MARPTPRRRAPLAACLALLALGSQLAACRCNPAGPAEKAHQKVCGGHRFRVLCKRCCKERGFAGYSWVGRHKLCGCTRPWKPSSVKPSLRVDPSKKARPRR